MKMNLYIEVHSMKCVCQGTGWIRKILRAAQECTDTKDASLIRYDHWLALGRPSTQEELIQKIMNAFVGRPREDAFVDDMCFAIEKVLMPPTCPAPLSGGEQNKGK